MNALHSQTHRDTVAQNDFAPQPFGLRARLRQRLGRPLKIAVPNKGPVAILQDACSVSCTLVVGRDDDVACCC
jgi:hypothetical protein